MQPRLIEKTNAVCGQLLDKTEETMRNRGLITKDIQRPADANLLKSLSWLLTQIFLAVIVLLRSLPQRLKDLPSNLSTYKNNAIQAVRSHLPNQSTSPKTTELTPSLQKSGEGQNETASEQPKEIPNEGKPIQQAKPDSIKTAEKKLEIVSPVNGPQGQAAKSPNVRTDEPALKEESSRKQSELPSTSPSGPKRSQNIPSEDQQKDLTGKIMGDELRNEKAEKVQKDRAALPEENLKKIEEEEEDHHVVAEFTNDPKVTEGVSFADVVKGNTEEIAAA